MTIKTATGIKRLFDEKNYGPWFSNLFSLVKTQDSCQPEQAIEPSATCGSLSLKSSSEDAQSGNSTEEMYAPVNKAGGTI